MTPNLRIAQAIVLADARGARVTAQSEDFDAPEAERIAVLFGTRPAGVACPLAHFACPFGTKHIAVVRAQDRPGPGEAMAFRILVLARDLYRHLGDPFAISDRFSVNWNATGTLASLEWPAELLPERTLEQLDGVLKNGDSGLLLGATQALVDGNRVLVQRNAPDEALARGLWQLLPNRSRVDLWPGSFAFSNELGLHFAVLPTVALETRSPAILTEEAVRDYPQSRYELNLQIAIESGDRAGLRRLLARRTVDESIRLALYMLAFALIVALIFRFVA
jgi:hypothetical protein